MCGDRGSAPSVAGRHRIVRACATALGHRGEEAHDDELLLGREGIGDAHHAGVHGGQGGADLLVGTGRRMQDLRPAIVRVRTTLEVARRDEPLDELRRRGGRDAEMVGEVGGADLVPAFSSAMR